MIGGSRRNRRKSQGLTRRQIPFDGRLLIQIGGLKDDMRVVAVYIHYKDAEEWQLLHIDDEG